jgi:hypothetical protein
MSEYYNYDVIAKDTFPPIKNKKISIKKNTSRLGGTYRFRFN